MSKNKNTDSDVDIKKKLKISLPIIIFAAAGIFALLIVTLLVLPQLSKIDELKTQIAEENTNLTILQKQVTRIEKEQAEVLTVEKIIEDTPSVIIPKKFDLTIFFETIDFFTHESKGYKLSQIALSKLTPSSINPKVNIMKFTLNIEGTPNKIIELIKIFEEDEQLFTVESIDIDSNLRVIDEAYKTIIEMTAYFINEDTNNLETNS